MNDTFEVPVKRRRGSRRGGIASERSRPRQVNTTNQIALAIAPGAIDGNAVVFVPQRDNEFRSVQPSELDRLYRSLAEVTPQNHPRTARLLASSTRKTAQKVIEEAGEVALEAVKHHTQGIIRESADLLYHLVALWHRAGIEPDDVWIEMRLRADTLGIAEKLPKTRNDYLEPPGTKTSGKE